MTLTNKENLFPIFLGIAGDWDECDVLLNWIFGGKLAGRCWTGYLLKFGFVTDVPIGRDTNHGFFAIVIAGKQYLVQAMLLDNLILLF